jgi:hypothetical protein
VLERHDGKYEFQIGTARAVIVATVDADFSQLTIGEIERIAQSHA